MLEEKNSKGFTGEWTLGDPSRELKSYQESIGYVNPFPKPTVVGTTSEKKKLTEGVKNDDGKPAFGLLAPEMLHGVSVILEYGARKYAARNWEKGISYTRVFGGLMRHLWAWWGGEKYDPETGYSHLWHAGCGIMFLIAYEARGMKEYDDRK